MNCATQITQSHLAEIINHNISRFDIEMGDTLSVQILNRKEGAFHDIAKLIQTADGFQRVQTPLHPP